MKIATAGFTCVDNYANLDNRHYPAGNGFDALVNLAKMGVECAVVSAVGPDKYGEEMFEVLKKYGVDSSHLHVLPGETSFMIMEMTEDNDRIHVKNIPGVMDDWELTRDDVEFLKGYDYVHTEFQSAVSLPGRAAAGRMQNYFRPVHLLRKTCRNGNPSQKYRLCFHVLSPER